MHLPRVRALPILLLIIIGFGLGLLGCAGDREAPSPPVEVSITDIPFDNGSNAIVSWRHFDVSSARRYDIYYTTDPESLDKHLDKLEPLSRSLQATTFTIEDTMACKILEREYYLVLEEVEDGVPFAHVVLATPENRDSLKNIGELIIGTEGAYCPEGQDERELKFANGKYFRVSPSEEALANIQRTLQKSSLQADSAGLSIAEGTGGLVLEVGPSQKEIDFVHAGERILPFDEQESKFLFKYGHEVTAILTEKARYSIASDVLQSFIIRKLKAGEEYHYKIIAQDNRGRESEPVTGSFIPVDEPPMAAVGMSAVFDPEQGKLLITWVGSNRAMPALSYFRDVDHYEIRRFSPEDTLRESGELLAKLNADFERNIFEGNFTTDDLFYIATIDEAGQRTTGEPFGVVEGKFEQPAMVTDLDLHDVDNDDGQSLALRWGLPMAGITLNVQDFAPDYTPIEMPKGYYLVGDQLVSFAEGDEIPTNALPVHSAKQSVPAKKFNVTFRYDAYFNDNNKIFFAKMRVDEGKWVVDHQELGFMNLPDFPAGEHVFEVILLDKNGRELTNPEAHVVRTYDINQTGMIPDPGPDDYLEVWRGNPAIEKKSEIFLKGTPNFDPNNKLTYQRVGKRDLRENQHQDNWPDSLRDMGEYRYFARVVAPDGSYTDSEIFGPMTPKSEFYHKEKTIVLVLVILFIIFVNYFLAAARKGKDFYLRPIAGIAHLDEALGRATEMGRPILYVLGLSSISDIATLAGLTILGRVAKKTAEFQTRLLVPCYDPLVLIIAQETVKTAYMDAGRPDAFNEDDIFYASGSQFSYAAAVAGLMVRFRTAANFYMGMFFAESLILTETGSMSGSIQIAGTDAVTQIPFFITTCDYTLIGEEIYAASAYLSQDPLQVGSLKAQDWLKAIYMVVIVLGTISMTSGFLWFVNLFKIRLGD